jgi:hypothetical protein
MSGAECPSRRPDRGPCDPALLADPHLATMRVSPALYRANVGEVRQDLPAAVPSIAAVGASHAPQCSMEACHLAGTDDQPLGTACQGRPDV